VRGSACWFSSEFFLSNSRYLQQPSLFSVSPLDQYQVPDEWTYTYLLSRNESIPRLHSHWSSWIVEDDFKRMADYGLNTVRIPVGYWMWNKTSDEPFVGYGDTDQNGTAPQLEYLEQALFWSSMYGMDVIMDMHGAVGSQSGQ
jgi:glucan 1,3-beta-glucosidase